MRVYAVAIGLVLASACASSPPPRPARASLDGALERWAGEGDRGSASDGAPSVALRTEAPRRPEATVRIARSEPEPADRGPRVDVRFEQAPLASALRLLAEAARLDVVIDEGVDGSVTLDLRAVRPLEAMRALAEAHRLELEVSGRTVVARRRGS